MGRREERLGRRLFVSINVVREGRDLEIVGETWTTSFLARRICLRREVRPKFPSTVMELSVRS